MDVVVKNGCGTCDFSPITATPTCHFGPHSSYTDTQLLRSGLPLTLTGQERVCRGGRGRTVHSDPMPLTQIHNCSGLHGDGCTLSRLLHPLYFHVRPRVHIQSPGVPIQIFIASACGEKLNPVESTLRAKVLRQPGASLRGEASSIKAPQLSSRRMRVCSGPEANRPPLSKKPLRV